MRETFMLELSLVPKDKEPAAAVYLMVHNICALVPTPKGTDILTTSGVVYTVTETVDTIRKKTKAVGTMTVL